MSVLLVVVTVSLSVQFSDSRNIMIGKDKIDI